MQLDCFWARPAPRHGAARTLSTSTRYMLWMTPSARSGPTWRVPVTSTNPSRKSTPAPGGTVARTTCRTSGCPEKQQPRIDETSPPARCNDRSIVSLPLLPSPALGADPVEDDLGIRDRVPAAQAQ